MNDQTQAAADCIDAQVAEITASLAEAEARAGRTEAAVERLRPYLDALPPGVWETWTACSYRRITAKGGADGGVLHAYNQRSDGHPDLSWTERECRAICEIVNTLRAALQEPPHGR